MNCQQLRNRIEDVIDKRLTPEQKVQVDLHLSRCPACRTFVAVERREHQAWFKALNDTSDVPKMSDGMMARLAREVRPSRTAGHIALPAWARRAAVWLVLLGGVAAAAWVGSEWTTPAPPETSTNRGGDEMTAGNTAVATAMVTVATLTAATPSGLYREGAEPAERAPASSAVSVGATTLDSRTVQSALSAAIVFSSDEARGLVVIVR